MKKQTPESILLHQVRDYLRLKGFYVIRNQAGLGTHPGLCDIIAISPKGGTFYIELKSPKGKLSPKQEVFKSELLSRDAAYCVVKTWKEFIEAFLW